MQLIPKPIFGYIEEELCSYDETKSKIEDADIPGKVVTTMALARMERTVNAIEQALIILREEHRKIFDLKYRNNLDWRKVVQEMPVSKDSYYFKKRRELVYMVAMQLGLINPK